MRTAILFCTLITPALAPDLDAQRPPTRAGGQTGGQQDIEDRIRRTSARSFRRIEVPGDVVERNVTKLRTGMRWHKTLASALAAGRSKQKPVVWIQALGDLDGYL